MADANSDGLAMARSPLAGIEPVSTVSALGAKRGVVLEVVPAGSVLLIMARRGKTDAVRTALQSCIGLEAPLVPARVTKAGVALVWSGPGQWLLMQDAHSESQLMSKAMAALAGLASMTDQSDARVHLRLAGPHVRDALAKLTGIDLHPDVFYKGAAAMTVIAHIPVHLWRLPDTSGNSVFEIAGPQSTAASLWHHVVEASKEYGLDARAQ